MLYGAIIGILCSALAFAQRPPDAQDQSHPPTTSEDTSLAPIEIYKDTDAIESIYKSSIRSHAVIKGLESLSDYRVREVATGKIIDHSTSWTVLYGVKRGTPRAIVREHVKTIRSAFATAHPEATSIKVRPIYETEVPLSEQEKPTEWRTQGPAKWVTHHLSRIAIVGATRLQQTGYQIALLGAAVALFRTVTVTSHWSSVGVLAQDALYVGMALTVSIPVNIALGLLPSQLNRLKNEWPRFVGAKRWIRPLLATAMADFSGQAFYAGFFRQLTFWAQKDHPELVADGTANPVSSAFSTGFMTEFFQIYGIGLITGPAVGNAVRKSLIRGWINKWTENLLLHLINTESQFSIMILASKPSLIPIYATISHSIKVAMWGVATLLPGKRGRAVVFPENMSTESKQDIFNRVGIPIDTFGVVDPQYVQEATYNAEKGVYEMSISDDARLRRSMCEDSLDD